MDEIYDIFVHRHQNFDDEVSKLYKSINESFDGEKEEALQYMIKAFSDVNSGRLFEALLSVDKIVTNEHFDPQIIYNTRRIYRVIYDHLVALAAANISAPQIGPVFDALLERGHIGIAMQAVAANHFEAIGQLERAQKIRNKITQLFPNYLENQ
ncbi:hypothetical protein CIK05_11860 [Bdellovibrio sp. qaytius]|nr:hypothetical protein CIK05_11860 [Bdellovibrio sp. qaytius]